MFIVYPCCLADHKVLSTLEKPRESASAPTLEAAIPETSHRSSVSSTDQILKNIILLENSIKHTTVWVFITNDLYYFFVLYFLCA